MEAPTTRQAVMIDEFFPLVVCVAPMRWDGEALAGMARLYDRLFDRRKRYALVTCSPREAESPGARERRMIGEWADSPRVAQASRELCVGSAVVVRSALARGALTAIMWIYRPTSPQEIVSSPEIGLDWAHERLVGAQLELGQPYQSVRRKLLARLAHP